MTGQNTVRASTDVLVASREQVSALIDGECDAATVDATVDALLVSDDLVRFWTEAHRAGDYLRSDEVVGVGDGDAFMRRFSAALADEPPLIAAPRRAAASTSGARRFWVRTGLPSASIAAALVAVAWVAVPGGRNDTPSTVAVKTIERATGAVDTPTITPVAAREVNVETLGDYLSAHREVSPFAYRGQPRASALTTAVPASGSQ